MSKTVVLSTAKVGELAHSTGWVTEVHSRFSDLDVLRLHHFPSILNIFTPIEI